MTANTKLTTEVVRNYGDQETVSRGLQRKLEGLLAGFAIIHPQEVLQVFSQIETRMINEIAKQWLQYLSNRHHDILLLKIDDRHNFISQLLIGFNGGKSKAQLFGWMNDTSSEYEPVFIEDNRIRWRGYDPATISSDLVKRIDIQHNLREGLPDLAEYVLEVLHR